MCEYLLSTQRMLTLAVCASLGLGSYSTYDIGRCMSMSSIHDWWYKFRVFRLCNFPIRSVRRTDTPKDRHQHPSATQFGYYIIDTTIVGDQKSCMHMNFPTNGKASLSKPMAYLKHIFTRSQAPWSVETHLLNRSNSIQVRYIAWWGDGFTNIVHYILGVL